MTKAVLPMVGQNIARWENQAEILGERKQSQERCQQPLEEKDVRASMVSHGPCGSA